MQRHDTPSISTAAPRGLRAPELRAPRPSLSRPSPSRPSPSRRLGAKVGSRVRIASIVSLAFALVPSLASATPPDTYGFGARARALGGAVTADVADSSASYHNPAGLAASDGIQLSVGYLNLSPFLNINGERANVERFGSLEVGMIAPVKISDVTVAFGLALMLPDQRLARTRSTILNRPRWEMYDTRSQRIFLAANLAIRPVRWLTIGAGIAFQAPSELTLDIRGDLALANPEANSRLEHQFKGDLTSIRYPAAGFQIRPNDWVAFGMAYRGQYELANRIVALADARVARVADLTFGLDTLATSLFGPQQISTSFAVHPLPSVRIGLELTWMNWSAHPSLIPTEDITLGLDPPIVDLPSNIEGRVAVPLGLRDVFVPRIGIEWMALRTNAVELDLRAGYYYEKTPFPLQRGIMNFVDGDEHTASIGFGLRLTDLRPTLPGALAINGYFQWSHIVSRTHMKDSLVDPVGDYTAGGNLIGMGLQLEVAFQ